MEKFRALRKYGRKRKSPRLGGRAHWQRNEIMRRLEDTQRKFFSALLMPLRGTSRESTELPPVSEGHTQEFFAKADELMKTSPNLSAAESLELYHRQYWFRLLDSIAEDFPTLQKIAGEETFWQLMEDYLTECNSSSFTLRHLGSRLADFIPDWNGADPDKRLWFAALARLEYAEMEVYEAAEWETATPENLSTAILGLQPHVILLDLPVPADLCETWEAFEPTEPSQTHMAVWRGEHGGGSKCRVDRIEFELLKRLKRGGSLASLFDEPCDEEPTANEVSEWFSNWQKRGWIAIPSPEDAENYPVVHQRGLRDIDWNRIDKMGSQARAMDTEST